MGEKIDPILKIENCCRSANKFWRRLTIFEGIQVKLGGTISSPRVLVNGVPQGAVLSPTLFNVAINDIIDNITSPIRCGLFADDFYVALPCSNVSLGEHLLQETLNKLLKWSTENGFQFSTNKTVGVHFCRRYRCNHSINVNLNNIPLLTESSARYLGIVFDAKLNWNLHIDSLRQSCLKRLNLLKKLAHTSYGASRANLLYIYHMLILSKINYGAAAYSSASPNTLNKLNTIHNLAIRLSTGAFRTSPICSLLCEASQPSLQSHRDLLEADAYIHTKSTPNLPLTLLHSCFLKVQTSSTTC